MNTVRIVYRDDAKYPWWIVYGFGEVWAEFKCRVGAELELKRIAKLLNVCCQ